MMLTPGPKQKFFDNNGNPLNGGLIFTYIPSTTTKIATYTNQAGTLNTNPIVLDYRGECDLWLDPSLTYKFTLAPAGDTDPPTKPIWTVDNITAMGTQADIGRILYPQTAAEIAAGVTPTNYYREPGDVRRYGAVGDGVTSDTAAINRALSINAPVFLFAGTYICANLSQTINFQRMYGFGDVRLKKNANGPIITSSGSDFEMNGIIAQGDAASPTFTGNGIVSSGNNLRLINCASFWISGRPVLATGSHTQINGTCSIYQTTDVSGTGYDIEIGVSGTATLYHVIQGVYTSQITGGILLIDVGAPNVSNSQFGKLTIAAGTTPPGTGAGSYTANRILGDIAVGLSNSAFSANVISNVAVTFAGGTSNHQFDGSNCLSGSATITDSSTNSTVVDSRLVPWQSYTATWTSSGVAPAIVNGSITARYSKEGRRVSVSILIVMGAGTTYGTGSYFFSLPAIPSTGLAQLEGNAKLFDSGTTVRIGAPLTLTDGTARCQVQTDNVGTAIGQTVPFTWAVSDQLSLSMTYYTD